MDVRAFIIVAVAVTYGQGMPRMRRTTSANRDPDPVQRLPSPESRKLERTRSSTVNNAKCGYVDIYKTNPPSVTLVACWVLATGSELWPR